MTNSQVAAFAAVISALKRAGLAPADALVGAASLLGVRLEPEVIPYRGRLGRRARSLLGTPDRNNVVQFGSAR